ncbi:UNVERIFIED_CONTAM: hypothetical protein Slati_2120200 [Sesamum latifolium]|uniref:Uncharacterized protein n=1 Tax=Sesamum latifolium TaxID=2727402 RepID=A0AAW2WRC9_9LAMI
MKTGEAVAARTRGKKNEGNVGVEEGKITTGKRKLVKGGRKIGASIVSAAAGIRSSPRLTKRVAST